MHEEKPQQTPPYPQANLINEYRQIVKNSGSQPEPQNPHLKPLGLVYKVCVQGTLSNVTEMTVIKSAHPARVSACVCSP